MVLSAESWWVALGEAQGCLIVVTVGNLGVDDIHLETATDQSYLEDDGGPR